MERIPEPELMNDMAQVNAYANADFNEPHETFIELFRKKTGGAIAGDKILDLGCGPGDICFRLLKHFQDVEITGIDGSAEMIQKGEELKKERAELRGKINFLHLRLPSPAIPELDYQFILSNSLLHHLLNPNWIWQTIKDFGKKGTKIFVMDLRRPGNRSLAKQMVKENSGSEPEVLQRDFFNSLLAAYRVEEVEKQLREFDMGNLRVEAVGDRHLIVWGTIGQ